MGVCRVAVCVWLVLALVASLGGVAVVPASSGGTYGHLFDVSLEGFSTHVVVGRVGFGFADVAGSRYLAAADLGTGEVRLLGSAESLGLDASAARFAEVGESTAAVTDGRLVLVYDVWGRGLGRLAGDNIRGVSLLPSGRLVAWGRDYVVAAGSPPRYVGLEFYDVWEAMFRLLGGGGLPPEELLRLGSGIDAEKVVERLREKLRDEADAIGGTLVEERVSARAYYDFITHTTSSARERLVVDIAAAIVLASGEVYAALNIYAPVVVEVAGVVLVVHDNETEVVELSVSEAFGPKVGVLASVGRGGEAKVLEIYEEVEAGAWGPALAYAYRPLLYDSLKRRVLRLVYEDGRSLSLPLYFDGRVSELRLAEDGRVCLLSLDTGTTVVLKDGVPLWSLVAGRVTDAGTTLSGRVYLSYVNAWGAYEVGFVDEYSGRYSKVVGDIPARVAGLYVVEDESLLLVVVDTGGSTTVSVYAREGSTARLRITVVDRLGREAGPVIRGSAEVEVKGMRFRLKVSDNPFSLSVPVPSSVRVSVAVPYGVAEDEVKVLSPTDAEYHVFVRLPLEPGYSSTGGALPYRSPFYMDYVLARDTEILRYVLPGARILDAHGAFLLAVGGGSEVSLYRLGGERLWFRELHGYVEEAALLYPYVVVRDSSGIHLLDVATGATRGTISMQADGFDVDLASDYASAWGGGVLAVLDARRGETVFVDMSRYGRVLAAPVVGGMVFAYVEGGGSISLYVVNPTRGTVVELLPLGARAVNGFATDGHFKAVSYVVGNETHTVVLSMSNGLVVLRGIGPVVAVRGLGHVARVPLWERVYGNAFALLLASSLRGLVLYAVGMNYVELATLESVDPSGVRLTQSFVVERLSRPNATPVLILRDLDGVPRVTLAASLTPAALAASEHFVAYSDREKTYAIPGPTLVGRYSLSVEAVDAETMSPLDASVEIPEYGISVEARGGKFKTYLSTPGRLTVRVSAPYYRPYTEVVELSDESPAAIVFAPLRPERFSITVRVSTPEGERVRDGIVTVIGWDPPTSASVNLSESDTVAGLRVNNYTVVFTSRLFTTASIDVELVGNTTVTLVVNRTAVRLRFSVRDERGRPIPGARVYASVEGVGDVELTADSKGVTGEVLAPYRSVVNFTASAPGYYAKRDSVEADLRVDGRPVEVTLSRLRGVVTIMLRDEEGNPVSATVFVKSAEGVEVVPPFVASDVHTVELEVGSYMVVGTTPDGRTATVAVTVSDAMPNPAVSLVFPAKKAPAYARYFPVVVAAAVCAVAAVAIYRKFFAKRKPKVVT